MIRRPIPIVVIAVIHLISVFFLAKMLLDIDVDFSFGLGVDRRQIELYAVPIGSAIVLNTMIGAGLLLRKKWGWGLASFAILSRLLKVGSAWWLAPDTAPVFRYSFRVALATFFISYLFGRRAFQYFELKSAYRLHYFVAFLCMTVLTVGLWALSGSSVPPGFR
ncbi:hypothetical protein ACR6HW_03840 [Fusibacter sp. JL298sf-3]